MLVSRCDLWRRNTYHWWVDWARSGDSLRKGSPRDPRVWLKHLVIQGEDQGA